MNLPESPEILLSVINTKLRDFYPSLDELCKSMDIEKEAIIEKLAKIDYAYQPEINQFI